MSYFSEFYYLELAKKEFVFNFSDYWQEISFCKFARQLLWVLNEIKRNR